MGSLEEGVKVLIGSTLLEESVEILLLTMDISALLSTVKFTSAKSLLTNLFTSGLLFTGTSSAITFRQNPFFPSL